MATFKALVSDYKKKDGTYNIIIRVYHNGKKRYIDTNFFLSNKDLTKSNKIKNQEYIDILDEIIKKCRNRCNENAARLGSLNVNNVVNWVEDIIKGKKSQNGFELDFIQFGREYTKKLKEEEKKVEKIGRGKSLNYSIALNNLEKYIGRDTLDISEITSKFIQGWIDWIREQPSPNNRKKGERAVSLYPSIIRALHNRAKEEYNDEDEGIIKIPLSPFSKIKLAPQPKTKKRALSPEKIKQILELADAEKSKPGTTNRYNLAKDVFTLSFCLLGINSIDLYFCDELKNGRLVYQRIKTHNRRDDQAEMNVKIEPEILYLFEKYKDETGLKVFNFHKLYSNAQNFNKNINMGLKQIGKEVGENDLQFYAARHSWATIARNKCGIPKHDIHEFLNHAPDKDMKVTDIYIEKDYSVQDIANRKVIDYILGL
jgi:integrase